MSRLVPRKGFDVVLDAVARLDGVHVAIIGTGRDAGRLARHARALGDRAHLLGSVPQTELPSLYACADVFAMLCRDRWAGVEAEGFGIVFLEAAACDVPSVAGRSGGSPEAVLDGQTGVVVEARDVDAARDAIGRLVRDDAWRRQLGDAGGRARPRRLLLRRARGPARAARRRVARHARSSDLTDRYAHRVPDVDDGSRIVTASWASVALFAVTAVPAAAGVTALNAVALATALALFVVGIAVWLWGFAIALVRSASGDDIVVASLFLLQGSPPRPVRRNLYLALAASVVIAGATGTADAFGILVPMLPIGLIGLWGARHGTFPPRKDRA